MKRAPQTLLLAVYSDAASAQDAFSALQSRRFSKCALISVADDTVSVETNALKLAVRVALCLAILVVFLVGAIYLGFSASIGLALGSMAAILLWIAITVHQGGRWTKVLDRISAWALPGESLVVVDVAPSQARDAQALLRRSASPPIYVVESGDELPQESQTIEETDICLSEDDFPASVTAWAGEEGPLGFASRRETLLNYLSQSEAEFEASLHDLNEAAQLGHTVTAVAEEVMDNAYLVRAHIADIRRNLPKRYGKVLPTLSAHGHTLRVYRLACLLANHAEARLNRRKIIVFLDAYQQVSPLRIAELWVFPLMLRLVLIQRLDRLARRVRHLQHLREAAYLWANRLINAVRRGSEQEERMTRELANEWYAFDRHFITSLSEQLRDNPNTLAMVQRWAEGSLGLPMSDLVRAQQSEEAADRVAVSNVLGSLRQLSQTDFTEVFETVSRIDEVLRRDPAGVYSSTDFKTRDLCRRSVEETARHSKTSEMDVAQLAVEAAAQDPSDPRRGHIGFHLIGDGLHAFEKSVHCRLPLRTRFQRFIRRRASTVYFGSIFAVTSILAALVIAIAHQAIPGNYLLLSVLGLASLFPLSDLAIQIVNAMMTSVLPPAALPKLDFEKGIPEQCTTLVVVPMMLSSPATVRNEIEKLEVRFFSNRDRALYFALLSDFNDAPEQHMPEDDGLLQLAIEGTGELNARHSGQPFLLLHRNRVWSETEQLWIGRERKRGKIEDLNRYLCGEKIPGGITLRAGNLPVSIQYVITLDSDTQLPAGTARRMIETIAHPLNRAEIGIDESGRPIRKRGYSIVQPRISIALPAATATRFTRLFNDTTGTDPYCQAVSDVYQDVFGEGIYHGKAIYDLHAFHQILDNRFPPETLLSHDLIEGVYAGVALASDIELLENFPLNYPAYSQRMHRWIRGDWQIASWILAHVPDGTGKRVRNPLSLASRWKIFDNLRRSLVPVGSLTLLLTGWLSGTVPVLWSLIVAAALLVPVLVVPIRRLTDRLRGRVYSWAGAADELKRALVMAALLPHQAWLTVDAIARVWYRRLVTRRHLLEWQTAEVANLVADRHLSRILVQMFAICASAALLTSGLFWAGIVWPTLPYLALWLISPELLAFIGAKSQAKIVPLREKDKVYLRLLARRTWRFFDELVNEENHWLPPDNYQTALRREVAQRTSPTNIGLWLTSALAACDFGYLTTDEFLARVSETLRTMQGLERYEGHLLNWYDTLTLEPLTPKYVSTVDSGNLLASLWVLEQGCESLATAPVIGPACLRGLMDTLAAAAKVCGNDAAASVPLRNLRGLFEGEGAGLEDLGKVRLSRLPVEQLLETLRWSADPGDERHYWITRLYLHTTAWTAAADRYLRWLELLAGPPDEFVRALGKQEAVARAELLKDIPSLRSLAGEEPAELRLLLDVRLRADGVPGKVRNWLDAVETEYQRSKDAAADALAKLTALQDSAHELADAIDMRLLYDDSRHLFAIGYRVGAPPEFNGHYDLLASECRLASLVAIAKGDVPMEHWLALGRPYRTLPSGQVLLSWGGTMFEYLMPIIYTRTHENSLLDNALRQAVTRQIEYCSSLRVPWGISESAYSAVDHNQIYQYRAFGVPGLGLKPGLEDDLVVSPYSTALALQVDPQEAVKNLQELARIGLGGPMGFIEAIDFTRENQRGDRGVPIETYMAHHQAMTLLAIDNTLNANVMQARFHRDLRVKAVEPLLFERIPATVSLLTDPEPEQIRPHMALDIGEPADRVLREDTPIPRAHLLGNGQYSLMLTNAGGGYSQWRDFDITRWRSDTTRDHWGSFCYLRDQRTGLTWSTGYHPVAAEDKSYFARFAADKVEFVRRETGLETLMEITVSPEDDAEIRRLSFTNRASRTRELEVTSYLELALAPHAADRAHPAFNKMFVETEVLPDRKALIARRRLRAPEDPEIWVGHLVVCSACKETLQFETDRATFIGRGGSLQRPGALRRELTNTVGAVLDPIFSLRQQLAVGPREKAYMTFVTVAGESRDAVLRLIDKYHRLDNIRRSFEMAWTHAQLEFRYLGIEADSSHWFQELASHLLYPNSRMRASAQRLAHNRLGQSRLWAHGISGDLPILLVTAGDRTSLDLVREALLAHTYWRLRGFKADLVILNQESHGYDQPLQDELQKLVEAHSVYAGMDRPGGVFLRKWHLIPEEELTQIFAVARATLSGNRGTLAKQVSRVGVAPRQLPAPFVPRGRVEEQPSPPLPFLDLPYFNGLGGFTPDGREYAIYFEPDAHTPTPWVNVMANLNFGAVVSESGPVFCWSGNSQQNRLTPWENDPVLNPPNSILYIRDEDSGAFWTPTRQPIRERDPYRARHGQGYTVFEHNSHAIQQILTIFVPVNQAGGDPIQVQRLSLRNYSSRKRRLAISFYAEWTLGTNREETAPHIVTTWDEASGSLMATNYYHRDSGSPVAFAALLPRATSYTGDRTHFLGRNRSLTSPAAMRRVHLGGHTGAGLDPCAALQTMVEIDPGQQIEVVALLGEGRDEGQARELLQRYGDLGRVEAEFSETCQFWDTTLGALQVRTPVLSIDFLMNRWLLYQTLSCRVWARSAFYQSGGAIGFRDQLQDVLGLLYCAPHLAREHIVEAAARQFVEGDVQHWWHPGSGLGIRGMCSDDLVWLPFAVTQYVAVTGDESILDEVVPFLEGPRLAEGEHEKLFVAAVSSESASVFEHCKRTLTRASALGPHGLPLIGNGDWNDGMNRIGIGGKGESVWLGWFLIDVLTRFARLCDQRDPAGAQQYRQLSGALARAIEAEAWDGEWYRRAYFDDGTPVGSRENSEARIDSLPQSWAAISGAGDPRRTAQALRSVDQHLVRPGLRTILLFTPPFDQAHPHPGYIMGYPPGIRENGGQYTHGALWLAMAHARLRGGARAVELLQYLNPIEHSRQPEDVLRYQSEPYAVAADVYNAPGREGKGGWTWYTGSAAWMYRVWLEEVLGLRVRGNELTLEPAIPKDWPGFEITYRYRSSTYRIAFDNKSPAPHPAINGKPAQSLPIKMVDDGRVHEIVLHLPSVREPASNEALRV